MREVLPDNVSVLLMTFLEDLRQAMGADLTSATVYGSAARGDFVEGVSDINLLLVARRLPVETLKAAGEVVRRWSERVPLAPVFATEDYILRSADVFPLEFLDMRATHRTLFGPDPLEGLAVDTASLRRQVEAELKGKLLRLRTAYAAASGEAAAVNQLIVDSFPAFRAIFGGLLRLAGQEPPASSSESAAVVCRVFGLEETAFDLVLAARAGGSAGRPDDVFRGYLDAVERLTDRVDRWETPST